MSHRLLFLVAPIFLGPTLFGQQHVTLNPIQDNTLYETTDGSLSDGAGDYLFVGRVGPTGGGTIRRALLKFDISAAIPSAATITSVTLTMNMSMTSSDTETIALQRVTADWGEGTSNANANEGAGAPASTNDATWIHRFFPSTKWTNPGGDFVPVVTASNQVSRIGSYSWGSTSQMMSDVQGWLASPSSNFGWIVIGNESAAKTTKRFDSRSEPRRHEPSKT